ncbi:MAG: hypothetical protein R2932_02360 [Caldilineaceae bacterium]
MALAHQQLAAGSPWCAMKLTSTSNPVTPAHLPHFHWSHGQQANPPARHRVWNGGGQLSTGY